MSPSGASSRKLPAEGRAAAAPDDDAHPGAAGGRSALGAGPGAAPGEVARTVPDHAAVASASGRDAGGRSPAGTAPRAGAGFSLLFERFRVTDAKSAIPARMLAAMDT
jgi:hypothetical protein